MLALYSRLEARLREQTPDEIAHAHRLAANILDPTHSNADQCWRVIWSKPLFANMRVRLGSRLEDALVPLMATAWQTIGKRGGDFEIIRVRRGRKNDAFNIVGDKAVAVRRSLRIAAYRLFAIQGAGAALRHRAMINYESPYNDLATRPLREAVEVVRNEMGQYWGHITVLHFLSDLGLACKPDRHLVRAMNALGMSIDSDKVPSLSQSVAINERLRLLATDLYGAWTPRNLRYLDKILMEISRQGIIGNLGYNNSRGRTGRCIHGDF